MASYDDASRGHDLPVHPPTGPVTKKPDSPLQPEVKEDPETKEQPTHDAVQPTDTTLKETTAADDDSDANAVKGWRLVAILVGVCVGSFLMSVDVFIIATAIPAITNAFSETSKIAWYAAAYSLTTCAMIPLAGKLASVFPLRWVYQIAFVIFLVGSVICGAAEGSDLFIFGRAVAGIGAAGIASGGLTVIVTISTPAKRPLFIGITSSMFALGVILAPIIGGALTEKVSWRWCFYINLPPGGVTLLIMYFFFRPRLIHADEPISKRIKRLDIIGALMFVPASFMLLIAMQWGGNRYPWNSATVIGLFVGGGVLTLIFIAWQWHQGDDALIPGTIVGRRNVALTCMFSFCFLGGLAVMSYYLPEWFQAVRGVSPLESGVRVLPSVITQILALLVVGAFATKLGYFNPWTIVGPILMAVAAGLFTTFKAFGTEPKEWIGYQVIQGIGVGITMQVPTLIMQQTLDGHPMLPIGVSMLLFSQYLGATVNQVIAGSVFNAYLRSSLEDRGVDGRQIAQLLAGGTIHVEETAKEYFPELLKPVLESYNHAITRVYFVPVAASCLGLFIALALKWERIKVAPTDKPKSETAQEGKEKLPEQSAV